MADAAPPKKPHFAGHRQRLRERLLNGGAEALPDYELLELVLFAAIPRGDVKPLAKELLAAFGDFAGVATAPPEALRKVPGAGDSVVAAVKAIEAAAVRLTRTRIMDQPVLKSWDRVIDYCQASMAHQKTEMFRLLFLDRKNKLIAEEVQQRGTVDHTPVYPREVMKRALELGASAIIMVHNHPSGDPSPSKADIQMTRDIVDAGKRLGISVHDHLIVGTQGHASLKAMGLI